MGWGNGKHRLRSYSSSARTFLCSCISASARFHKDACRAARLVWGSPHTAKAHHWKQCLKQVWFWGKNSRHTLSVTTVFRGALNSLCLFSLLSTPWSIHQDLILTDTGLVTHFRINGAVNRENEEDVVWLEILTTASEVPGGVQPSGSLSPCFGTLILSSEHCSLAVAQESWIISKY